MSDLRPRRLLRRVAICAAIAWIPVPTDADTLQVGNEFPSIKLLQSDAVNRHALNSVKQIQRKKAIVFVFASW